MGQTRLSIALAPPCADGVAENRLRETTSAVPPPRGFLSIPASLRTLPPRTPRGDRDASSAGSAAEHVSRWLQRIIELQQTGAGSPEFYGRTARALVDLVNMDLGMVLLERDGSWSIAGSATVSDKISMHYSQTLVRSRRRRAERPSTRTWTSWTSPRAWRTSSRAWPRRSSASRKTWWACCTACACSRAGQSRRHRALGGPIGATPCGGRGGQLGAVDGPADAGAVRAILLVGPGARAGARRKPAGRPQRRGDGPLQRSARLHRPLGKARRPEDLPHAARHDGAAFGADRRAWRRDRRLCRRRHPCHVECPGQAVRPRRAGLPGRAGHARRTARPERPLGRQRRPARWPWGSASIPGRPSWAIPAARENSSTGRTAMP